jgi:hypothetical protein
MDPVYNNFNILTNILQTILGSMDSMRSAMAGASNGFLGIVQTTFGKLQNTFQQVIQLFGRVRSIMNRMVTSFAVLMNIVSTGVQTGQSVANGPIGQAAGLAAALCWQGKIPPAALPVRHLQEALLSDPQAPAGPVPLWDTPWHHPNTHHAHRHIPCRGDG